ncbi:MAG: NYN domain-containing protein [bacterium]|nr:NYN domain-containing protein [bacterium]MCY3891067.1 NYN domain-containing protein [bacterium]MCY4134525.1 NYN domain-containing protein [bacterium]
MPNTRVAVFIDYQNVYHGARDLFFSSGRIPSPLGSIDPLRFGVLLCDLGKVKDPRRVLAGVRVYRGQPDSRSGMKLSRSFDRQVEAWKQMPGVTVRTRPLTYHRTSNPGQKPKWTAEEKGVDVMMALDISIGARNDVYDVAIIASSDSDFVPALEDAVHVGKRVETATWWIPKSPRGQLRLPGRNIWNHCLDKSQFDLVRDDTDYSAESS